MLCFRAAHHPPGHEIFRREAHDGLEIPQVRRRSQRDVSSPRFGSSVQWWMPSIATQTCTCTCVYGEHSGIIRVLPPK